MPTIIDTANMPEDMNKDETLWAYNGLDIGITYEILNTLKENCDDVTLHTYKFSKDLQAPVLEMMLRGMLVDKATKSRVIRRMNKKLTLLEENFHTILKEGVGVDINWRSPVQLNSLLYDVLNLPVQKKRNTNGAYLPYSGREALEALSVHYIAEPICRHILAMRDLGKSISFLQSSVDPDGRMRSSLSIAGTNTGRLSSSASDFGTGCVRPTAQALTPEGWKPIQDLADGDQIAQYASGVISFTPATFYWTDFDGELLQYKTEQVSLCVTPGHRVLSADYEGRWVTKSAADTLNYAQRRLPVAGNIFLGGSLEYPAYLAMLMADCSKEPTQWRGAWSKPKKIRRAKELLTLAGVPFKLQKARENYVRMAIKADPQFPKRYGPWVLNLTPASAKALVDEARHWDAHVRGASFIFYTAHKDEANWFQTLCHLVGYGTTTREQINSDKAYGANSIIYSVNVKPRDKAQVLKKHWSSVPYKGKVGCPTVPSSYWLVKEDGFISVTGNTNLQNVTSSLRSVFIADPGMKFANLDLEQADSRNVGALCWSAFVESHGEAWAGKYLDLCESGDLHTAVCKMANPELFAAHPGMSDRQIADMPAYRNKTYRDNSKVLGHGSVYLGTPGTMSKHSKLPVKLVAEFQKNFFTALPCIPAWHDATITSLKNNQCLVTPFKRRRFFFGRLNDVKIHREAIAFVPQSMTSDEINTGIMELWKSNRVQLLMQVHDSILFQYHEEQEDEIIPWALEALKTKLILERGREFVVPTEAMIGWNWGYYDEQENPNGLKKWKGSDNRTREEALVQSLSVSDLKF